MFVDPDQSNPTRVPASFESQAADVGGAVFALVPQAAVTLDSAAGIYDEDGASELSANYRLRARSDGSTHDHNSFLPEVVRTTIRPIDQVLANALIAHLTNMRPAVPGQTLLDRFEVNRSAQDNLVAIPYALSLDGQRIAGIRIEAFGMVGLGATVGQRLLTAVIAAPLAPLLTLEFATVYPGWRPSADVVPRHPSPKD